MFFFFRVLLRDISEQSSGDISQKWGGVHSGLCSCLSTVTRQPSRMVLSFFPLFFFFFVPLPFFFFLLYVQRSFFFFFRAHMRAHTSESSRGASHDSISQIRKKKKRTAHFSCLHGLQSKRKSADETTKQQQQKERKKKKRERTSLRISLSECLALTHGAA